MKKILLTLSMTALLLFTAGCSCPFSDKNADNKPQLPKSHPISATKS